MEKCQPAGGTANPISPVHTRMMMILYSMLKTIVVLMFIIQINLNIDSKTI